MEFTVRPRGICAMQINFEIDENKKVRNVKFIGGCGGNTKGIAALVEGMDAQDVIDRLEHTDCNGKGTSCPDQLAKAVAAALKEE